MNSFLSLIMISSFILGFIGYTLGVIAAFQKSSTWGCISLIFHPIGVIVFLIMTWRENLRPLILVFLGAVGCAMSILLLDMLFY